MRALGAIVPVILLLAASPATRAADPPPFRSESAPFVQLRPVVIAPDTAVATLDGVEVRLADYRGQVVLLNVWATWCLPCVRELPALDRLAAAAPPGLAVIGLSIDAAGAPAVAPFVAARGLAHMRVWLDPAQRLGSLTASGAAPAPLPLWGLPISYVIDRQGRAVGYLTGAAAWDSPQALDFLRHFLAAPA
ncbi:MAG: TlpA family protein disulfide reductase [Alphaproteobacteria bacterium]